MKDFGHKVRVILLGELFVDDDLQELRLAWDNHYNLQFPEPPYTGDSALADLYGELVLYDGHIAGLILRIMDSARNIPFPLDSEDTMST